ncbi:hypothetical protein OIT44_02095 [Weissella ceti]|uniref:Uncharacterized protein n=1 Tax=Weissella ceti TaxID=759620 RepID=A0ABT3E365_9LACO|nr:hypothetical protein [Weissella ceti]MCW0952860.1 hypothetical protein [Weissella ceti]QVK12556.1 hypothetical protein KHQ31_02725 [Weissella ceti]
MTTIKKYAGIISLTSSLILLGLLWLSVAMDDTNVRLITTGYMIVYLMFGKWLKKQRQEEKQENKN